MWLVPNIRILVGNFLEECVDLGNLLSGSVEFPINNSPKAIAVKRLRRVLARAPTAKVRAGNQDVRFGEPLLIQNMILRGSVRLVEPHVEKRKLPQPYKDETLPEAPDELRIELTQRYFGIYSALTGGKEIPFDPSEDTHKAICTAVEPGLY